MLTYIHSELKIYNINALFYIKIPLTYWRANFNFMAIGNGVILLIIYTIYMYVLYTIQNFIPINYICTFMYFFINLTKVQHLIENNQGV